MKSVECRVEISPFQLHPSHIRVRLRATPAFGKLTASPADALADSGSNNHEAAGLPGVVRRAGPAGGENGTKWHGFRIFEERSGVAEQG